MSFSTAKSHFDRAAAEANDPAIAALAQGLAELSRAIKRQLDTIEAAAEKAARK